METVPDTGPSNRHVEITDHHVRVDGGRCFVRVWNSRTPSKAAAPIVLFHDSLGCVELWRDFPIELCLLTGRTVLAYDRLGFGRSDPLTRQLSTNFIAIEGTAGLLPILQALGIGEWIGFGHSVGGGMALHAAMTVPGCRATVARRLVVGNGLDPTSTLGPLNNEMQLQRVRNLERSARERGATLTPIGSAGPDLTLDDGYFMMPALATDIDESFELVSEEQFGPVLPILGFDDVDDAIRRANDTEFGLCSSVWSADEDRAFDVARQLQSGVGWVNQHGLAGLDFMLSAGGVKQSGFGREGGIDGMRGFTNERYVTSR